MWLYFGGNALLSLREGTAGDEVEKGTMGGRRE